VQAWTHSFWKVSQEVFQPKVSQDENVDMLQLTEQQLVSMRSATKSLADIFAEDTATPTTQDEVMNLLQQKSTELGFKEPGAWLSSLMPNKGDVSIAVAGVGAGTGAIIVAYLKAYIPPLATVGATLLQGIVGWLLYKWAMRKGGNMGTYISAYGGGMVIGAIANFVASTVSGGFTIGHSSASSTGVPADVLAAVGG